LQQVIFILGPTAVGKTDLAVNLTQHLPCELISVDSALIYRQMDIGTGKPQFFHHLIDICEPYESYSAANFRHDALNLIKQIHARGNVPVLVGGTFLYFKALLHNLADLPKSCKQIRQQLQTKLAKNGINALHQELATIDAVSAAKIHSNDTQRILRALEVFYVSGKPLSYYLERERDYQFPYQLVQFGVTCERSFLHEKIAKRFMLMLEQGFLSEAEQLYHRGDLTAEMPSMRAVGYRQFWQYLAGEISFDEACERAIIATRQLAKRQFTWLRSWQNVHYLDSSQTNNLDRLLSVLKAI